MGTKRRGRAWVDRVWVTELWDERNGRWVPCAQASLSREDARIAKREWSKGSSDRFRVERYVRED